MHNFPLQLVYDKSGDIVDERQKIVLFYLNVPFATMPFWSKDFASGCKRAHFHIGKACISLTMVWHRNRLTPTKHIFLMFILPGSTCCAPLTLHKEVIILYRYLCRRRARLWAQLLGWN
jgi:hypothetical protein